MQQVLNRRSSSVNVLAEEMKCTPKNQAEISSDHPVVECLRPKKTTAISGVKRLNPSQEHHHLSRCPDRCNRRSAKEAPGAGKMMQKSVRGTGLVSAGLTSCSQRQVQTSGCHIGTHFLMSSRVAVILNQVVVRRRTSFNLSSLVMTVLITTTMMLMHQVPLVCSNRRTHHPAFSRRQYPYPPFQSYLSPLLQSSPSVIDNSFLNAQHASIAGSNHQYQQHPNQHPHQLIAGSSDQPGIPMHHSALMSPASSDFYPHFDHSPPPFSFAPSHSSAPPTGSSPLQRQSGGGGTAVPSVVKHPGTCTFQRSQPACTFSLLCYLAGGLPVEGCEGDTGLTCCLLYPGSGVASLPPPPPPLLPAFDPTPQSSLSGQPPAPYSPIRDPQPGPPLQPSPSYQSYPSSYSDYLNPDPAYGNNNNNADSVPDAYTPATSRESGPQQPPQQHQSHYPEPVSPAVNVINNNPPPLHHQYPHILPVPVSGVSQSTSHSTAGTSAPETTSPVINNKNKNYLPQPAPSSLLASHVSMESPDLKDNAVRRTIGSDPVADSLNSLTSDGMERQQHARNFAGDDGQYILLLFRTSSHTPHSSYFYSFRRKILFLHAFLMKILFSFASICLSLSFCMFEVHALEMSGDSFTFFLSFISRAFAGV